MEQWIFLRLLVGLKIYERVAYSGMLMVSQENKPQTLYKEKIKDIYINTTMTKLTYNKNDFK